MSTADFATPTINGYSPTTGAYVGQSYDPNVQIYTSPGGPQAQDPSATLLSQMQDAIKAAAAPPAPTANPNPGSGPETPGAQTAAAPATTPADQGTPAAAPAAAPAAPDHVSSTQVPGFDTTAILGRLAPMGIKSLDDLKTKSDTELQKLSGDVVAYEQRQSAMDRFFFKNPDGTYDFTKGADGNPTGLDAHGKFVPPGTTPAPGVTPTPAPTPSPSPKPTPKPAPKPAPKPVAKPAPKPAPKPVAKPAPKPAPKKVVAPPAKKVAVATSARKPGAAPKVTPKPAAKPAGVPHGARL